MHANLQAIGTDTELFLHDARGNPVPVVGLLGGTKQVPLAVQQLNETFNDVGFAVQEDNVMVEFNIPPALSGDHLDAYIGAMYKHLSAHFKPLGLTVHATPSEDFQEAQLQTEQAQTFGCDPDFCVWTRSMNIIDASLPELRTLRTAGGHVHVSFNVHGQEELELADKFLMIKALDLYLGVPSVLLDTAGKRRREIYGKAGAFRDKPYGVEYRVLSNFWAGRSSYRRWTFSQVYRAFDFLASRNAEKRLDDVGDVIVNAINHSDTALAEGLIQMFNLQLPKA